MTCDTAELMSIFVIGTYTNCLTNYYSNNNSRSRLVHQFFVYDLAFRLHLYVSYSSKYNQQFTILSLLTNQIVMKRLFSRIQSYRKSTPLAINNYIQKIVGCIPRSAGKKFFYQSENHRVLCEMKE